MDTSVYKENTKKTTGSFYPLFLLMLSNAVIAVIYLFLVRQNNYTFSINNEPSFALDGNILFWITFGMIILIGVVPYMLFNKSNFKTDRHGLRLNYSLYYIHFLLFLMWALFSFTLKMPVIGVIFLGMAIALGVFVMYRFMTNTIVAGSIITIWGLWLIYVFILNFAYILLQT